MNGKSFWAESNTDELFLCISFYWIPITVRLAISMGMAKKAIYGHFSHLAINGPYSHGQRHRQHGCYGYLVKTYAKTNSSVLDSAQQDFPFKSYSCLSFCVSNLHCKNGTFPPNLLPPEILGLERKEN